VKRRWGKLSPGVQMALVGSGSLLAGGFAIRESVSHVPLRKFPKAWGPYVAAYAAAPVIGTIFAQKFRGKPASETVRTKKKALLGQALLGVSSFLGERALVHSIPIYTPKRIWSRNNLTSTRMGFLLGHVVPLAAAAVGTAYTGIKLQHHRSQPRLIEEQPKVSGKGAILFAAGTLASTALPATRQAHQIRRLYHITASPTLSFWQRIRDRRRQRST